MKITKIALSLSLICLVGSVQAAVMTTGSTTGAAGVTTAPVPITVTSDGSVALVQAELTYPNTQILLTQANIVNSPGFTCSVNQATGKILILGGSDTGPLTGTPNPVCTVAYPITAAATFPIALTLQNKLCSTFDGNQTGQPCTSVSGSITGGGAPGAPTATIAGTAVLTGGAGTVAVNVTGAGSAGGSLGLACTIPATGASAFAVTAGAGRTIAGPAALGANAPAIGLSCVPGVAPVVAVLSCAQTPTPASALAPLTSNVTCPGVAPASITPNLLGGTSAAPVTLTVANGTAQPVGTVVNVTGLTITGAGFVAPATGSWGACTYSADATPPASTTSDPTAFTAGPQLVFNAANNGTAQPQVIGATRRAGQVSAILTCPVLPAGTAPAATANVYRLVLAAGAPVASAVTPVTAPGNVNLPSYNLPTGSSSTTLSFNVAGANGSVTCVAAGAGYSVTPSPLALVVGTPGAVTVTYTGAAAGTFAGTLTCNAVAPSTGGPFTYNLSTTVGAALAAPVQVPALGNISLMLLIAGFLGLGAVLVGRRQA